MGIVVVSFNSEHLLGSSLPPLCAIPNLEVVMVDNASQDTSASIASGLNLRTVVLNRNFGYATACNAGVEAMATAPTWLGFVNPDVFIEGRHILEMLAGVPHNFAIVSPLVLDERGHPQRDLVRPELTLGGMLLRYLLSARMEVRARKVFRRLCQSEQRYFLTEVTSGGCLFIRSSLFEDLNGFRETFFLNGEDVDLCYRARRLGEKIVIDRHIIAKHQKGTSSLGVPSAARLLECARAEVQYFEYHKPGWQTGVVAATVVVGCYIRLLVRRVLDKRSRDALPIVRLMSALMGDVWRSVQRARKGVPHTAPARSSFV